MFIVTFMYMYLRITSPHNVSVVNRVTESIGTDEFSKELIRGELCYSYPRILVHAQTIMLSASAAVTHYLIANIVLFRFFA